MTDIVLDPEGFIVKDKEGEKRFLVAACSTALTFVPKLAAKKSKIKVFEQREKDLEIYHET